MALADAAAENWPVLALLCMVLAGLVIVLGVAVMWLRRRFIEGEATGQREPMTLGDLRDLRAQGLLSQQEFDRLKGAIIDAARADAGLDDRSGTLREAGEPSDKPSPLAGPAEAGEGEPSAPASEDAPRQDAGREGEPDGDAGPKKER